MNYSLKKRWFRLLAIIFLLIIISCGTGERISRSKNKKIVFLSNREAPIRQFDIFIMNIDGTEQKNITSGMPGIRSISSPRISPDGGEILFLAFEGDKRYLRKIIVNTRQVITLNEVMADIPDAQFSPDGQKIIFVDQIDQRFQIFMMNSDGTQRQNLSQNLLDERDPAFAPDGKSIVYASRKDQAYSIWRMSTDGSDKVLLTENPGNDRDPAFAPDGKKIVFSSQRGVNMDICTVNRDGSQPAIIFQSDAHETKPQYSPDGTKILFLSNLRGMRYLDILVYDVNKKTTTNLTRSFDFINQNPCFTGDSENMVFESIQFGNADIYRLNLIDQKMLRLTDNPKWDFAPDL